MDQQPVQQLQTSTPPVQTIEQPKTNAPVEEVVAVSDASHTSKKTVALIAGLFAVALVLVAGSVYIMGVNNRTQQLGSYKKTPPAVKQLPPSAEEEALQTLDTGDPTQELQQLKQEHSSIPNN